MDITFTILDTAETLTLPTRIVRGFDDVDEVRLVRPVRTVAADGTVRHRAAGFQRVITVNLGSVTSVSTQSFLTRWLLAIERTLTYAGETAAVSLVDPKGYASEALAGRIFRRFVIQAIDRTVRLDAPYSWQEAPVTWTNWDQTNIRPFGDTDYTFDSLP